MYTRWQLNGTTNIVLFDLKDDIKARIRKYVLEDLNEDDLNDPDWFHLRIFEDLIRLQDAAVWAIRGLVRKIELVSLQQPIFQFTLNSYADEDIAL
jgi:hypothetical protein